MRKRIKDERGAIVVEATISFTTFIFLLYIIYSIVDICYIQAKMSIALNSAATDISQYSYLYYKFGIDSVDNAASNAASSSRASPSDFVRVHQPMCGARELVRKNRWIRNYENK